MITYRIDLHRRLGLLTVLKCIFWKVGGLERSFFVMVCGVVGCCVDIRPVGGGEAGPVEVYFLWEGCHGKEYEGLFMVIDDPAIATLIWS